MSLPMTRHLSFLALQESSIVAIGYGFRFPLGPFLSFRTTRGGQYHRRHSWLLQSLQSREHRLNDGTIPFFATTITTSSTLSTTGSYGLKLMLSTRWIYSFKGSMKSFYKRFHRGSIRDNGIIPNGDAAWLH
jgi:hypothetical protein